MILVTGVNQKQFVLNSEIIEKIEEVPESVITLTNGNKYIVVESIDEIISKVVEYKRRIYNMNFKSSGK